MISTKDRATFDRAAFHAPDQLGRTRRLTPEGFLLCEGVAIARTGEQMYHESELPLDAATDGTITVTRPPEEVFSAVSMASFEGKPVTMDHPLGFVNPQNWRELEVGTVHNVRRGDGIEGDMLIADLLIKDQAAIDFVNKQMPQVSCGYDCEYSQTEPGHAIQRDIVGNHLALVDRGRAGPRCAIKDHDPKLMAPDLNRINARFWATRDAMEIDLAPRRGEAQVARPKAWFNGSPAERNQIRR